MRTAMVERRTGETSVQVEINLDQFNDPVIETDVPFFDHMLEQIGRHGNMALRVEASGDTDVDSHHLVEDTGIVFGQALDEALDDREGIRRYASLTLPFDETLVRAALDVSGRGLLEHDLDVEGDVEGFPLELLPEFFRSLVREANLTLHLNQLTRSSMRVDLSGLGLGRVDLRVGRGSPVNRHHLAEATFKAFARVLRGAAETVEDDVPSTKGTLSE